MAPKAYSSDPGESKSSKMQSKSISNLSQSMHLAKAISQVNDECSALWFLFVINCYLCETAIEMSLFTSYLVLSTLTISHTLNLYLFYFSLDLPLSSLCLLLLHIIQYKWYLQCDPQTKQQSDLESHFLLWSQILYSLVWSYTAKIYLWPLSCDARHITLYSIQLYVDCLMKK